MHECKHFQGWPALPGHENCWVTEIEKDRKNKWCTQCNESEWEFRASEMYLGPTTSRNKCSGGVWCDKGRLFMMWLSQLAEENGQSFFAWCAESSFKGGMTTPPVAHLSVELLATLRAQVWRFLACVWSPHLRRGDFVCG